MKNSNTKSYRTEMIKSRLLEEIQMLVEGEIRDPRVFGRVNVTNVMVTDDLSLCRVFVDLVDKEDDKKKIMQGLKNSVGFIRTQVAHSLNTKKTPEIDFKFDESLEKTNRIEELLEEIKTKNQLYHLHHN